MNLRMSVIPAIVVAAVVLGGSYYAAGKFHMERLRYDRSAMLEARLAMPATVADTPCAIPGGYGPGCWAMTSSTNSVYDSVIYGGNGTYQSGDEWPVNVWKVTTCTAEGGDPDSITTFNAALDSASVHNGSEMNVILGWTSGACDFNEFEGELDNTVIALQSAPGEGLTFYGGGSIRLRNSGSNVSNDLVIGGMRLARAGCQGLYVESGQRIYIDHVTSRWHSCAGGQYNATVGGDSTQATYNPNEVVQDITIGRSAFYEAKYDHPTNLGIDASARDAPPCRRIMAIRVVFPDTRGHRAPMVECDTALIAGPLIYNWKNRGSEANNQFLVDFLGGHSITGAATDRGANRYRPFRIASGCEENLAGGGDATCEQGLLVRNWTWWDGATGDTVDLTHNDGDDADSIWIGSNRLLGCRSVSESGTESPAWDCASEGDTVATGMRRSTAYTASDFGIPARWYPTADTAWMDATRRQALIDSAGAAFRVSCSGFRVAARDSIDDDRFARLANDIAGTTPVGQSGFVDDSAAVNDVVFNTGINNSGDTVHTGPIVINTMGLPASGTACEDKDSDGMPDSAEVIMGLDTTTVDNGGDVNANNIPDIIDIWWANAAPLGADTYGNALRIHLGLWIQTVDSSPDTSEIDTTLWVDPDSTVFVSADSLFTLLAVNDTEFLLVTLDTISGSGYALLDSAQVDSICSANSISGCPGLVRNRSPGR